MYENSFQINRKIKNPPKVIMIEKKGSRIKKSLTLPLIKEFCENIKPVVKNIKANVIITVVAVIVI